MITTSIVFDHRGRVKRKCEGPLELRVTIDRKPYYINTGVRVYRNEWKLGAVVNRPDSDELNERLAIVKKKAENEVNYCLAHDVPIDVAFIRRKVLDIDTATDTHEVLKWMYERMEMLPISSKSKDHYKVTLRRFADFGQVRRWADVDIDIIYRWDGYLRKMTKPLTQAQKLMNKQPEHLSDAGIYNYHKHIRRLLGIAEKIGKIARNPYSLLTKEFARGDAENVEYLTDSEIQALQSAKLQKGSHLDMVRDMFLIQMYTGMAYADLMEFDISDYRKVDGKWVTNADRVKTGVAFVAHLLPPVVEILEKYDMQVPKMTNEAYNRALKKIQEKAGITTRLHTHLARHTFATFMLNNGVKIENLQRMMGHRNILMTQRYAKTLAQSVHSEFDMIAEKMKKDNQ